jgi:hypothetical protein
MFMRTHIRWFAIVKERRNRVVGQFEVPFGIRHFPRVAVEHAFRRTKVAPSFAEYSHKAEGSESGQSGNSK